MGTAEQKWKATLSHFFLKVLHEKGLLKRVYTQNIDCLDFQLGGFVLQSFSEIRNAEFEVCCLLMYFKLAFESRLHLYNTSLYDI